MGVVAAACGQSAATSDGGTPPVDAGADATLPTVDASDDVANAQDTAPPPADAGLDVWQPRLLTCPAPGNYDKQNETGQCGVDRWTIKTGTDTAAKSISMMPTITTTTELVRLASPTITSTTPRTAPTETKLFALRDVKIQLARLESDSDYHLVLAQGPYTMIAEVPFPGCVNASSPWYCLITRARAAVDAKIQVTTVGSNPGLVASIVGVGFFDDEHAQTGAAPNQIELHAVLAICFGEGCDPELQ